MSGEETEFNCQVQKHTFSSIEICCRSRHAHRHLQILLAFYGVRLFRISKLPIELFPLLRVTQANVHFIHNLSHVVTDTNESTE